MSRLQRSGISAGQVGTFLKIESGSVKGIRLLQSIRVGLQILFHRSVADMQCCISCRETRSDSTSAVRPTVPTVIRGVGTCRRVIYYDIMEYILYAVCVVLGI